MDSLAIYTPLPSAYNLSLEEWSAWALTQKAPKFVAKQIMGWIYQKKVTSPDLFTNLPLSLREQLAKDFSFAFPEITSRLISQDGSEKLLLKTPDGLLLEMVIMPYENRSTLCLSCQVGCKMGCTFCQTGRMGLTRNLSSGEILTQVLLADQLLKESDPQARITNVVFMGMGEPLDNYEQVVKACKVMIDPDSLGLSKQRVTISTSGLIPEIERLGKDLPVRLAISLHSANSKKRSEMMPVNRKYPLDQLKKVLLAYPAPARLGITFEYVMIEGVNDTAEDAKLLVNFLHGINAKVNLIPINHFPGMDMEASSAARIKSFQKYLTDRYIPAPIRYSRGQDISGGCGQLAAKAKEELHLDPRVLEKSRRAEKRNK